MDPSNIDATQIRNYWEPHLNRIPAETVSNWHFSADTKWFLSNVGIQTNIGVNGNGWAKYTSPYRIINEGDAFIVVGKVDVINVVFAIQESSDIVTMLELDKPRRPNIINSTILHYMKFVTASRLIFDTVGDVHKSEAFVELRKNMQLCDPPAFEGGYSVWFWVVEEWISAYYDPLG